MERRPTRDWEVEKVELRGWAPQWQSQDLPVYLRARSKTMNTGPHVGLNT